jgi:6-pyruvoyltetrahydropterin/6-carboxytetrahydropterin synthase
VEVYELYVETHFSSAHLLKGYPGECARLHGHNWIVRVFVRCSRLNELGMGLDFKDIKKAAKEALQDIDHRLLNDLPAFAGANPTAENIARHVYREVGRRINGPAVSVCRVEISETPTAGAIYREE